jgi:glycosyltransferase involved in cell wall biosynthesis
MVVADNSSGDGGTDMVRRQLPSGQRVRESRPVRPAPGAAQVIRAVVQYTDSNGFGGAEQVMLQLLGGLDRDRWRPVLLHHGKPALARLVAGARALGVETHIAPRVSRPRHLSRMPGLLRAIRGTEATVFHAHLPAPLTGKYGLLAAAMSRVPAIVATAHLVDDVPVSLRATLSQRLATTCVDRYVAVSGGAARRMRMRLRIPADRIQVIRNGIDVESFGRQADPRLKATLAGEGGRPVVLTVGRLDAQKGHTHLLAAAVHLPGVALVLAGEGRERGDLERQAQALGIADRVRFLGHRDDVPDLLSVCDVFVLPSLYEGLPLAALEAMAAAKPVVATAIEGTDEAVVQGETGLLVPPGQPQELAAAIRLLLGDATLATRMGQAGRQRARREFSIGRMIDEISRTYDGLLDRSKNAR